MSSWSYGVTGRNEIILQMSVPYVYRTRTWLSIVCLPGKLDYREMITKHKARYPIMHCPGALLVSILTSNKTWRTRNAVRSSNGDCEKTAQHFAMMSASDFFVGYIRSSMAGCFLLSILRLAEKRAKRFRNVTRNFACLLLVSRTSQENVLLVIQILTCKWIMLRVFLSLYCRQSSATKICYVSIARLTMMFVEWDKRQIS